MTGHVKLIIIGNQDLDMTGMINGKESTQGPDKTFVRKNM